MQLQLDQCAQAMTLLLQLGLELTQWFDFSFWRPVEAFAAAGQTRFIWCGEYRAAVKASTCIIPP
jgi:hypothetical protein